MSNPRHVLVVAALIRRSIDGKYLMLKRAQSKDYAPGQWECITGRVEQGESIVEALYREVKEETNIIVRAVDQLGFGHFYRGASQAENEVQMVYTLCQTQDGQSLTMSDEHSDYRWGSPDELAPHLHQGHFLLELLNRAELVPGTVNSLQMISHSEAPS